MLKLLLIAPTCDGQDIGEAWSAYQWVRCLAPRHEVTVLTYYKRGRARLSCQLPGVRVIEWAEPPGLGRAERFNSLLKPGYVPFYFRARRWIRTAVARGEQFDLAHQLAPLALRYPSPVAGLGIPFVIGPVGGSLQSPDGFRAEEGTTAWYVRLRSLDRARLRRDPWLRRTYEQADCVIGIAPYVADLLAGTPVRRFAVMSDTGLERLPEPVDRTARRHSAVRLLFVGRLVRTKGARDAIRALSLIRDLPARLDIVGDGFDRGACEALASELGLADRVCFHGWLPRSRIDEFYRSADVFVFPSYREPGGTVTFEAMGHGLPVLASDLGGPGVVVDETCGIRVHPVSPEQYARDLAVALTRLVTEPELRRSLGEGARCRVAEIGLWDSKARQLETIYANALAG
ncbi:MAG TPA: glycosyltransferase [Streptosporangiaceae bacterium]|nr:glycosyltransferase [Streptosporangiaceae bacterium]